MPKSEFAHALDSIQESLALELKAQRFRVRGRTFNRQSADGLTQVLTIQMGSFGPPGTTYLPGLRENLYGRFTVNLGVYVPEVAASLRAGAVKSFVQEPSCCIRARLGKLGKDGSDLWWSIDRPKAVTKDLLPRIRHDAMSFFARHESRDLILAELGRRPESVGAGGPPRIVCAIILAARGDACAARELLAKQAQETRNPGHAEYVRDLAERLGLGSLDLDAPPRG